MKQTTETTEVVYETEDLLHSKALADVQPDFARAVLTGEFYTLAEARQALNQFFDKGCVE